MGQGLGSIHRNRQGGENTTQRFNLMQANGRAGHQRRVCLMDTPMEWNALWVGLNNDESVATNEESYARHVVCHARNHDWRMHTNECELDWK
jgi:hypothetical protein